MRLTLFRHARSIHIQSGFISRIKSCTGLLPKGYAQSRPWRAASGSLATTPAARYCFPAPFYAPSRPPKFLRKPCQDYPILDPELVELRPGDADGMTYPEYRERYGDFNPEHDPTRLFAPTAELVWFSG